MTKPPVRPCIPNTLNKTQSTDSIATMGKAVQRHINFTDATKERMLNRLRCKAYGRCNGAIRELLLSTDNSNKPNSSQFTFIEVLGKAFIEECSSMFLDSEAPMYHITIVSDEHNQPEDTPEFNLKKFKNQIRSFFSHHLPGCHLIGFIEFQYVKIKKEYEEKALIGMHCHLILYSFELSDKKRLRLKEKNNRFFSSICKHPILIQNVENTYDSKHRLFSYLIKLPTKKLVLDNGREKTKSAKRPVSIKQQMRILEILSYIPISSRVFAIGHGCEIKRRVLSRVTDRKNCSADAVVVIDNSYLDSTWGVYRKAAGLKHLQKPIVHI